MRAELANLNHCAVSFLGRATASLCWYYATYLFLLLSAIRNGLCLATLTVCKNKSCYSQTVLKEEYILGLQSDGPWRGVGFRATVRRYLERSRF